MTTLKRLSAGLPAASMLLACTLAIAADYCITGVGNFVGKNFNSIRGSACTASDGSHVRFSLMLTLQPGSEHRRDPVLRAA